MFEKLEEKTSSFEAEMNPHLNMHLTNHELNETLGKTHWQHCQCWPALDNRDTGCVLHICSSWFQNQTQPPHSHSYYKVTKSNHHYQIGEKYLQKIQESCRFLANAPDNLNSRVFWGNWGRKPNTIFISLSLIRRMCLKLRP